MSWYTYVINLYIIAPCLSCLFIFLFSYLSNNWLISSCAGDISLNLVSSFLNSISGNSDSILMSSSLYSCSNLFVNLLFISLLSSFDSSLISSFFSSTILSELFSTFISLPSTSLSTDSSNNSE